MESLWQKLKSTAIGRAVSIMLAALLFGAAAASLARQRAKAVAHNQSSAENAAAGAGHAVEKAKAHKQRAEKHHERALKARAAAERNLDKIGDSDATLAAMVSAWNFDRLRK